MTKVEIDFQGKGLVISVYLSSLSVAHLSNGPRRRLVVTGDSARIQDETNENSAWFCNMLGLKHRHTGPRFNVSSERQLIILVGQPGKGMAKIGFFHGLCNFLQQANN